MVHDVDTGPDDTLSVFDEKPVSGSLPRWSFNGHLYNQSFFADRNIWFRLISSGDPGISSRQFKIEFQSVFNESEWCQELSAPDNGQIFGSNFTVGSEVQFRCDSGFQLQGVASLQCLDGDTGTYWSGLPPSCQVPCFWNKDHLGRNGSFYRVPQDIDVILSPNYPENVVGPISCAWEITAPDGLNLSTDSLTPIDAPFALEIWANQMVAFLQPGLSRSLILNVTNFQEPVSLSIPVTAVSIILKVQRVSSIGLFVLQIKRIRDRSCELPPLRDHLTYSPSKVQYDLGDVITYSCEGTYAFTTPLNLTNVCSSDGLWEKEKPDSLPICSPDCLTWSPSQQIYIPTVFTSVSGWLYSKAYPNTIPLGICNYTFLGEPGERFTLELLSAVITTTELFIVEPIGWTQDWDSSVYLSKSNVVYLLVNQSSSSSQDNFVLRFHKEATAITCPAPSLPQFMAYHGLNFTVGSTISFQCEPSFEVVGTNQSTCVLRNSTTAEWSPRVPVCVGKCGGTFVSDNITIVSPEFPNSYDSKDISSCVWNVRNVKDVPFRMSLPVMNMMTVDNLTVSNSLETMFLNDICSWNCTWFQSVISSSQATVELSLSGERHYVDVPLMFSIMFVSTALITCKNPDNLVNGQIMASDFLEGSSIHFICHPPYDLDGFHEATCVGSGEGLPEWDHPTPRCLIPDCTPPSSPQLRGPGRGSIASPGYPGNILKGQQECIWIISAADESDRLLLHFQYMELPDSQSGRVASVLIFDVGDNKDDLLANFTAGAPTEDLTSTTNVVKVEYYGPLDNVRGYRGIYLDYEFIEKPLSTSFEPPTTTSTKVAPMTSLETTTIPTTTIEVLQTSTAKPTKKAPLSTTSSPTTLSATTRHPSTISPSHRTTRQLEQRENESESNTGRIVAGILVPMFGVIFVALMGYAWYRHKYPVRMVLGKDFGKFANPIYEKGASTLTLVREDVPKRDAE
ncbi:CUB and sushi domain-containing protein 3-like [Liolophura sinensis]|uniref:CUB and sushi domain-containing protein 3-like n=1 Tax=Liolophura sinensis TaxID=3198878 RepID=UPI0031582A24